MYTVKLNKSDEEFWNSYLCKIFSLIDIYTEEKQHEKDIAEGRNNIQGSIEDIL